MRSTKEINTGYSLEDILKQYDVKRETLKQELLSKFNSLDNPSDILVKLEYLLQVENDIGKLQAYINVNNAILDIELDEI